MPYVQAARPSEFSHYGKSRAHMQEHSVRNSSSQSYATCWRAFTRMPNRQDFSHREADAKSLLDEVLRRGRGERWGRIGMMDGSGLVDGNDGTTCGGYSPRCAQHFRSRVLVRLRTRLRRSPIGVSGRLPGCYGSPKLGRWARRLV